MNHIFKKVWNKSLGRMVVTSELAKTNVVGSSGIDKKARSLEIKIILLFSSLSNFSFKSLTFVLVTILGYGQVWAGDVCDATAANGKANSTAPGTNAFACGRDNITSGNYSIAVGYNNQASSGGIVFGSYNSASSGVALGYRNSTASTTSTAIGYHNQVTGSFSSALGTNNNALGQYSNAIGLYSLALGNASNALGSGNVTIGLSATAIGSLSTLQGNRTPVVTYGSDGRINSIDGISVLTTSNSWVDLINPSNADKLISVNGVTLDIDQSRKFLFSVSSGGNIAAGIGSTVVGYNNIALGNNSSVFGAQSKATHNSATAIGHQAETDRENSLSVGKSGAEKQITFVAAGTEDTDAVNLKQVTDLIAAGGGSVVASDNYAQTASHVALGSANGTAYTLEYDNADNPTKIMKVGNINVTATGITLDTITQVNGTAITPEQLA